MIKTRHNGFQLANDALNCKFNKLQGQVKRLRETNAKKD